jgi:hypothetical protein
MEIEAVPLSYQFNLLESAFNPFTHPYFWYIIGGLGIVLLLTACFFCIKCCLKSNIHSSRHVAPATVRNLYTPPNPSPPLQPFSPGNPRYFSNTIAYFPLTDEPSAPIRNSVPEPETEMDTVS